MEELSYKRRETNIVRIATVEIGGNNPIAVQSMTNTPTADIEASVRQIESIAKAGAPIVRLTAQGKKEGEAFEQIMPRIRKDGYPTAIVADIHFVPEIANIAARWVDKVRVNPGNYNNSHGEFQALIAQCRKRGVAIRIGVNHGSLARHIMQKFGDTQEGMVESAMEFLRICKQENFDQVVVSMKSSNTRVMVYAYRLLVKAMQEEDMTYPLHLGVTEAGNGLDGRIRSAVGIGALLSDGIGDTIRVSLTETPENEIPVALQLVDHFKNRTARFPADNTNYSPYSFQRRSDVATPICSEEITSVFKVVTATSDNPTHEWRSQLLTMGSTPAVIHRVYKGTDVTKIAIEAAADMGQLFLDGLADGIWVEAPEISKEECKEIELSILQAARVRMSKTEYIACPSCGRTLYDIETTLHKIKSRTSHLKGLKIGIMGCIVNGPGEMADADYGYVGAAAGNITLYRGREVVERNIPQEEAIDHLIEIIRKDGRWIEP